LTEIHLHDGPLDAAVVGRVWKQRSVLQPVR
jgi:hypothetical protein